MACGQVEDLVLSELEKLKNGGFSSTAVEAALNSIEFDLRENNTGSFPRGLSLMLRSMSSWIYDKDPFQPLQWTDSLEHFKVSSCFSLIITLVIITIVIVIVTAVAGVVIIIILLSLLLLLLLLLILLCCCGLLFHHHLQ